MFDFAAPKVLRKAGKVALTALERELEEFAQLQEITNKQSAEKLVIKKQERTDKHEEYMLDKSKEFAKSAMSAADKALVKQFRKDLGL